MDLNNWLNENKERVKLIYCLNCNHIWILFSDKKLIDEQIRIWLEKAENQHLKIQEEENDLGLNFM
jgi:hypothetical protein